MRNIKINILLMITTFLSSFHSIANKTGFMEVDPTEDNLDIIDNLTEEGVLYQIRETQYYGVDHDLLNDYESSTYDEYDEYYAKGAKNLEQLRLLFGEEVVLRFVDIFHLPMGSQGVGPP